MLLTKQMLVAIDFHSIFFPVLWKTMANDNSFCWLVNVCVVSRQVLKRDMDERKK